MTRVRRHRNVLVALVGLTLNLEPNVSCQQAAHLTFRARVSELPLQNNPLARNKRPEDFVEIALPGRLHNPPLLVNLIQKSQADWSTPEDAIASIRSANTAGDAPAERAGIRNLMADASVFKRNRDYYNTVRKAEITGSAVYGDYTIVFLREESDPGRTVMVPVTLTKTASGWKQTNALSKDNTFDVVWTALRNGGVH